MNKNYILATIITLSLAGIYYFSTTTIYIIRHGEKVILEGISDAPLTDTGKTQAQTLGAILSKKYIPSLYVSPMRRARETAGIIALKTHSSMILDERLTEKNYRKSNTMYDDGNAICVKNLPNGTKETKEQHLTRLLNFLKDTITPFNKNLYIVAHGGTILRLFEKIASDTHQPQEEHKIPYCSVFMFSYNKLTGSLKYLGNNIL